MKHIDLIDRYTGAFVDFLFLLVLTVVTGGLISAYRPEIFVYLKVGNIIDAAIFYIMTFLLFGWVYFASLESSHFQTTLGKWLVNGIVTDSNGKRISFIRASFRYVMKTLLIGVEIILPIGFSWLIDRPNKHGMFLHDKITDTVITKK